MLLEFNKRTIPAQQIDGCESAVQSQLDLLRKLLCGFLCSWERSHSWLKTWRRWEWMWDTKPGMLGMTCISIPLLPQWFVCLPCPRCPDPDCVSESCWLARVSSMTVSNLFFYICIFRSELFWFVWCEFSSLDERLMIYLSSHTIFGFVHFHLIFLLIFPWSAAEVHGGSMCETFSKNVGIWYCKNASSFRTSQFVLAI